MIGIRSTAETAAIMEASNQTERDGIARAVYKIQGATGPRFVILVAGQLAKPANSELCFITTPRAEGRNNLVYSILL